MQNQESSKIPSNLVTVMFRRDLPAVGEMFLKNNHTTFNARTYLQPQLKKACKSSEKRGCGDVNPKDFILFNKNDCTVDKTWKDNTGERNYIEDMTFPTLNFPSKYHFMIM